MFRAEDSNTHRHLTEFVGLDLEMAFKFQNEYDFCQKVARECGALALTFYSRCGGAAAHKNVKIVSKSSATDLVTDGDKAVEAFFIKTVRKIAYFC